jgi:hypothetical protein
MFDRDGRLAARASAGRDLGIDRFCAKKDDQRGQE